MTKILLFYCFIVFSSCLGSQQKKPLSKNQYNENTIERCLLTQEDFTIKSNNFEIFQLELDSFLKSKYKYDILKIYIKGGDPNQSYCERWFLNNRKEWNMVFISEEKKLNSSFSVDSTELTNSLRKIEYGSFIQNCLYSSSNTTYLYLIKLNGNLRFQYYSIFEDLRFLSKPEKDKIDDAMMFYSVLKKSVEIPIAGATSGD